ncbi:MAG: FtsQ-type POTRA domain-containing protein [Myxococcaceae bacterium]|nr:FtsQ-type POTRA domain-containing protein [Myxococcaceae bacterium]MBH2006319.1 FtsQ-type POTRA domain-containing protein [Myxococcaceae bacterium]
MIRIGILGIIFLVTGSFIPLIYVWVTSDSGLTIRTIHIQGGVHARDEELQLYLSEFIGKSLYGTDLKRVQKVAGQHPWVRSVRVRRQPPQALDVIVVEREATALLKNHKLWVLDLHGVAFKAAETEEEFSLPQVSSPECVGVLEAHRRVSQPGGTIVQIESSGANQFRVLFASGLEVLLGSQNWDEQWKKLVRVLNQLGNKRELLAFVYLDDTPKSNQIAVRFKKR